MCLSVQATHNHDHAADSTHGSATVPIRTCPGGLAVNVAHRSQLVTSVQLSGDLDLGSAAPVLQCVSDLPHGERRIVQFDLGDVAFCDVAGIRVLVAAADAVRGARDGVMITDLSLAVNRLLTLTGLRDALLFGTTESR